MPRPTRHPERTDQNTVAARGRATSYAVRAMRAGPTGPTGEAITSPNRTDPTRTDPCGQPKVTRRTRSAPSGSPPLASALVVASHSCSRPGTLTTVRSRPYVPM